MDRKITALFQSAAAWAIALTVIAWGAPATADEPAAQVRVGRADYPRHAPRLVEQALTATVAGQSDERAALLKRAVDADGDFAPAHWQRGELKFDGQWRTPEEVAKHVAADDRWKDYAAQSSEASASPVEQQQLALWCMRHDLPDEERYHWSNVILANPAHLQARQRLGLQDHQGRLVSGEEIAAEKQRRDQAKEDLARFKPKYLAWCREATSSLKVKREPALDKIRNIDDPAAISALREAVRQTVRTTAGEPHRNELVLAMTAAFSRMPQHEATLQLAGLSLYSSIPEVRQAAAEALRPRLATDYVPMLMQLLKAPKEADVDFFAAPDGTVRMIETVYQKQPLQETVRTRNTSFETEGALGRDRTKIDTDAVLNRHLRRAASRAGATQSRVEAYNATVADRNKRVQETLKIALGMEAAPDDVPAWWSAWQSYNELEFTHASEEVREAYFDENYIFVYEQTPPPTIALEGEPSSPRAPRAPTMPRASAVSTMTRVPELRVGIADVSFAMARSTSCFAPGTIVWKNSGPTPIEHIRVGDMVLAQHPATGELAYRPVLETSVGNPTPVLRVKLPSDEIVATLGHRFWVEGAGWAMAKELQADRSLHAVSGGLPIESVEPAGEMECHNLVVGDFHTFVIGNSKILVHDKTCPQPTLAVTPGLADPKLKLAAMQLASPSPTTAAE